MSAIQQALMCASAGGAPPVTYRSRLQFGGADASTTFTDDTGKTWTSVNAEIDTSLGDQRGLFNGSSARIKTPSHADLVFGTGDFKIAFTQRFNNKSGYQTILSKGYFGDLSGKWLLQTGNGDGLLNWYWSAGAGASFVLGESSGTVNNGQDYAIEIERTGGTIYIRRDGSVTASTSDTNNYNDAFGDLILGSASSVSEGAFPFNGWIKDFRIT